MAMLIHRAGTPVEHAAPLIRREFVKSAWDRLHAQRKSDQQVALGEMHAFAKVLEILRDSADCALKPGIADLDELQRWKRDGLEEVFRYLNNHPALIREFLGIDSETLEPVEDS